MSRQGFLRTPRLLLHQALFRLRHSRIQCRRRRVCRRIGRRIGRRVGRRIWRRVGRRIRRWVGRRGWRRRRDWRRRRRRGRHRRWRRRRRRSRLVVRFLFLLAVLSARSGRRLLFYSGLFFIAFQQFVGLCSNLFHIKALSSSNKIDGSIPPTSGKSTGSLHTPFFGSSVVTKKVPAPSTSVVIR